MQLLIEKAQKGESYLTQEILDLPGMSSPWNRHLLNLICENKTYMEVGTYKGSTLISATYQNGCKGLAYDDYRNKKFGDHRQEVINKIQRFDIDAELIIKDGLKHTNGSFDVIFYDGDHGREDTFIAVTHLWNHLNRGGYLIIDDYQFEEVTEGVEMGLKKLREFEVTYLESQRKDDPETWWNGLAIIKKK